MPRGVRAAATSRGPRQGSASGHAIRTWHLPSSADAAGPPPPGGPDEADDLDQAAMQLWDPASDVWTAVLGTSKRGDGVPAAPGMLDSESVAAGILKAKGAILGLFQETGLQDPQGVLHMENQWRHHGYHAFLGVDPQAALADVVRGGLLIALRANRFAAEQV